MSQSNIKIKIQKVDDDSLSISRRKYGRGFQYFDENNKKVTSKKLLRRLKELIIPPMWSSVYICKWPDGHIQAIGRDLKGRKQYIYHSEWERKRQQEKFAKMVDFGKQLPKLRKIVQQHIQSEQWNKNKILSLMVSMLDETGIRIGNRQYAERNGTYGLSTLRRKHVELKGQKLILEYKGKSNKQRHVEIDDPELIQLIKQTAELPGYELFRYIDDDGNSQNVDSEDVNDYIHKYMGEKFYSKDFRTWVASRLVIELYPTAIKIKKEAKRSKFTNILLRLVADELGNTPTVCRSYYIHPTILNKIEDQSLDHIKEDHQSLLTSLSKSERYLLSLI